MAAEWQETELGNIATLKRGFDLPIQDRRDGRVPVVSSSGVIETHSEFMVSAPGVVTGRYGTIGEVFYLERDFWPLNTTLFVRDFKGNDPRFIFYLLKTIDFQSCSDKSSVPGVNRNHLHRLRVCLPQSVDEQRAIAHILGTLDIQAIANFNLNRLDAAEKSTREVEKKPHQNVPQLHVLLADILLQKQDYAKAGGELRTYLKEFPNGQLASEVQKKLDQIEKFAVGAESKSKPLPEPPKTPPAVEELGQSKPQQMEEALVEKPAAEPLASPDSKREKADRWYLPILTALFLRSRPGLPVR